MFIIYKSYYIKNVNDDAFCNVFSMYNSQCTIHNAPYATSAPGSKKIEGQAFHNRLEAKLPTKD